MAPASELESQVGQNIADVLGVEYRSEHLGGTDEHDRTILRGDDVIAIVEVTEDCDEELQASLAHSYEHPEEVVRDLQSGQESGSLRLTP